LLSNIKPKSQAVGSKGKKDIHIREKSHKNLSSDDIIIYVETSKEF
jgi:hypothetical protein